MNMMPRYSTIINGMPTHTAGPSVCKDGPVYEIAAGTPSWCKLYKLVAEKTAQLVARAVVCAIKAHGRSTASCEKRLSALRNYLTSELPAEIVRDVLDVCLARDRFRCHHNPSDCLALELWRVFFDHKFGDVSVVHHEFAFPKTTNYPDIVQNLERLFELVSEPQRHEEHPLSFKLELKHCEVGCFLQDKVIDCVGHLAHSLRVLEIPGLGSDELLHVIARHCTNLEVLNVKGSREQISDCGFTAYVDQCCVQARSKLGQLDVTRCMLSQQALPSLQALVGLRDLRISTRVLDEISCGCDGQAVLTNDAGDLLGLERAALPAVTAVTVEHDNVVQVSVNQVTAYLRHMFPNATQIALRNCIACELHVTLTQHPSNITYMRQNIHTLELISADYFNFPRLVYPCPNLEMLHIEKPTNDIFNTDQQNVPFLYGNTVPFENLKVLRLSRISLTNLTQFLSKSTHLRAFKVTNIGRRERPRWTDQRIKQILPLGSVPALEDFHVSCLPNEGLSTVENHRYLHLTKATVQYLAENFIHLKRIAGIETWNPRNCERESLNLILSSGTLAGKFNVTF